MRNVALYIILSPFDNEQSDLIQRILKEKTLEEIPVYKSLLEQFVNMELIDQVINELYLDFWTLFNKFSALAAGVFLEEKETVNAFLKPFVRQTALADYSLSLIHI